MFRIEGINTSFRTLWESPSKTDTYKEWKRLLLHNPEVYYKQVRMVTTYKSLVREVIEYEDLSKR